MIRTGIQAVLGDGPALAGLALGRARSRAGAAVHAAAAIGHGRTAAGVPGAGASAASRGLVKGVVHQWIIFGSCPFNASHQPISVALGGVDIEGVRLSELRELAKFSGFG